MVERSMVECSGEYQASFNMFHNAKLFRQILVTQLIIQPFYSILTHIHSVLQIPRRTLTPTDLQPDILSGRRDGGNLENSLARSGRQLSGVHVVLERQLSLYSHLHPVRRAPIRVGHLHLGSQWDPGRVQREEQ